MVARKLGVAALAFGVAACTVYPPGRGAQSTQSSMEKSIDAAFDDVYARYRLPGLALGVVRDGEIIYTRTVGETSAGSGEHIDNRTLFKIASNSKAMTTGVLARLVDAGKLHWDDPVTRYLPQFRMYDPWVTRAMQVRDLLLHNTGLPEGAGDLMFWPEPNLFTRADVIAGLAHLKPTRSFRSHYDYDNLMYVVAGEVAGAAAGTSYEAVVRRELFEPLQMSGREVGGTAAAAGGIRCSLDDMLKWVRMCLDSDSQWLTPAQRQAVWTPHVPMPLSASGVMFADRTVPPPAGLNSVPPENSRPGNGVPMSSIGVWQSAHTAALTMYSPYATLLVFGGMGLNAAGAGIVRTTNGSGNGSRRSGTVCSTGFSVRM